MQNIVMFELKPEHLQLMKELSFKPEFYSPYGDFLAPSVDLKRPFGNSCALESVCDMLGCHADAGGEFNNKDMKQAATLIAELPVALSFVLNTQEFRPGCYLLDNYGYASSALFYMRMAKNYIALYDTLAECRDKDLFEAFGHEQQLTEACVNTTGHNDPFRNAITSLTFAVKDPTSGFTDSQRRAAKRILDIFEKYHNAYLLKLGTYPADAITSFRDADAFLSNFYTGVVSAHGVSYCCAEAAFQAQKCETIEERVQFRDMSGAEAKEAGRKVDLRKDWEKVKNDEMYHILRHKFAPEHKVVRQALLDTGNRMLIEGNTWHDNYWGACTCPQCKGKGQNMLGKMLMCVRTEIRNTTSQC